MRLNKRELLVGISLLLTMLGMLMVATLAIGVLALRPSARLKLVSSPAPGWTLAMPAAFATLAPTATPLPNFDSVAAPATQPERVAVSVSPAAIPPSENQLEGLSPTPTSASAATRAGSPTPTASPTNTPTPTITPTLTPTPQSPGRISGQMTVDGAPAGAGVTLRLEDQATNTIAETTTGADGSFAFSNLGPSSEGYNVVFAQEWNEDYEGEQFITWGWMGPVTMDAGAQIDLPDFDISMRGFGQLSPEPNAAFSAATLSAENPIQFEWSDYAQSASYWVDLARGEAADQHVIWQSSLSPAASLAFDGRLGDGDRIQSGAYWWGVGARGATGSYPLTVYGQLSALVIK